MPILPYNPQINPYQQTRFGPTKCIDAKDDVFDQRYGCFQISIAPYLNVGWALKAVKSCACFPGGTPML